MKKRALSIVLTLALCLSLLPTAAWAEQDPDPVPASQEDTTQAAPVEQDVVLEEQDTEKQDAEEQDTEKQDGEEQVPETTPLTYSGGSGTKSDPWLISSVEDLQTLQRTVNDGAAADFDANCTDTGDGIPGNYHAYYFKQTEDLDLSGIASWDPIGYSGSYYFAGNYDGDGHTISGAQSTGKLDEDENDPGYATAGVFGWVAFGSVSNLCVKNVNFSATGEKRYSYVGGIAAVVYGSTIENCSVMNSQLESKRNPDNNNNCAGGITGYSTGGTFVKCASVSNEIKTQAYGGGFVGETDDDYAGDSTYTNCYVVNCSVGASITYVSGSSIVGGFAGEMTATDLRLNRCYVYNTTISTEGTSAYDKCTGVFAGNLWGGSEISATDCFYGVCNVTENAGDAAEKTKEEFQNGTVASLLGEDFAQGKDGYPVFTIHADRIALDQSALTLSVGVTKTLTATLSPADATDTVTWTSSEEDIATVENGVVTAKAVGETMITATAGGASARCTVEVVECDHAEINDDGQCKTCGYQFAFKTTDADGNLKGFYDKIYDAFVDLPISGGTVTLLKNADGETQYSPRATKTFIVDIQDHKLSTNSVHGFSPKAKVTITGGRDSQIDTVTADQYVNVTLASTFQGTITTLNATDGKLAVQPGCTAHVKTLYSSYDSTERIQLMGGSYDEITISASGLKLGDLLETGYRFENTDDSGLDLYYSDSLSKNNTNLKVVLCEQHDYENGFCKYCNEKCPHTNVNENNQCEDCKAQMIAVVMKGVEITGYYDSLQSAVDAAAGGTVKLLEGVTADAVTISAPITLDLCGKKIIADLTVTDIGAKLTDSVGNGGIKQLTVAEGMTVASLLEEGFLFRNSSGRWVTDLTVTELKNVYIAEIPIRLGEMKSSYDVVYKAENKNIITLEVFAPKSVTFGEHDLFLEVEIKDQNGNRIDSSTGWTTLDPDNKRAAFSLDKSLTGLDAGTYQCTVKSVKYHPSQMDAYTLTGPSFTVNVLQSGTKAEVEVGVTDGYFDQRDTFNYGERITVHVKFPPTGERPVATLSMTEPTESLCAVFDENGKQISQVNTIGTYEEWLSISSTDLGVGTHQLTMRYLGGSNQEAATVPFTVTVTPCTITRLALDETQLTYTGAAQTKGVAAVTAGELTLTADDYDVRGNVQTDVGSYELTVTGKGNYTGTLTEKYTIAKAAAPEAEHGAMTVSNNHAATYKMEIPALPALDAGCTYGTVSYALGEVDLNQGYYDKETGAKVVDGKLILPIVANPVEVTGSIGTVTIKVTTDNYEDFFLTIDVSATNKIVPTGGGGGGGSSGGSAKSDDITTTVKTDENGNAQTEVKVSGKALSDAKKSGEAVKIPTGVKAGKSSNSAPVVKIDLPKNAGETRVEIPVDNVTSGTVAVIVHEDGTEEILKSSKPTENGMEFTIDGSATVKIMDNGKHFEDTKDHWAKGAIDYISARDLVSGVSDTQFAPDMTATRAQMWTILARMDGETVIGGQTWYEQPQLWAKKNGVSDGTDPNGTITRAQMVTMLWRSAGSPTTGSGNKFTDVPADSYYAPAVDWAAESGITTGVGGGRFDPNAPCTRAQLATFLYQNMQ